MIGRKSFWTFSSQLLRLARVSDNLNQHFLMCLLGRQLLRLSRVSNCFESTFFDVFFRHNCYDWLVFQFFETTFLMCFLRDNC